MKIPYVSNVTKVMAILCIAGVVASFFIRADKTMGDKIGHPSNLAGTDAKADMTKTLTPIESQTAAVRQRFSKLENVKATPLPSGPVTLRTLNSFREERASPSNALKNWDALLLKSTEADAQSKITVFEAANWCLSQKAELLKMRISRARGGQASEKQLDELKYVTDTCKVISEDTSARRFDFLESAASSGNQEALIAYEKYLFLAPQNDPAWLWKNSERVGQMSFKAVGFLEQAASQGIKEAFDELASIYATGRYGYKDEVRANAYRTQLSKLPLSFEEHRLASK